MVGLLIAVEVQESMPITLTYANMKETRNEIQRDQQRRKNSQPNWILVVSNFHHGNNSVVKWLVRMASTWVLGEP